MSKQVKKDKPKEPVAPPKPKEKPQTSGDDNFDDAIDKILGIPKK